MALKDLLPKSVYEAQKELFKRILDGGKKELKKKADEIYIIQKDVILDLQLNLEDVAKREAKKFFAEKYDEFCAMVKAKVPFVGGVIASILKKYKDKIVEAIV